MSHEDGSYIAEEKEGVSVNEIAEEEGSVRTRKFTEKGRLLKISGIKDKRRKVERKLLTQKKTINDFMESGDYKMVKKELKIFDINFVKYFNFNSELHSLISGQELENDIANLEFADKAAFSFKTKVFEWSKQYKHDSDSISQTSKISRNSSKSNVSNFSSKGSSISSRGSRRSNFSVISNVSAKEQKLKVAELLAKKKFFDIQEDLNLKLKQVKLEQEIMEATAKLEILNEGAPVDNNFKTHENQFPGLVTNSAELGTKRTLHHNSLSENYHEQNPDKCRQKVSNSTNLFSHTPESLSHPHKNPSENCLKNISNSKSSAPDFADHSNSCHDSNTQITPGHKIVSESKYFSYPNDRVIKQYPATPFKEITESNQIKKCLPENYLEKPKLELETERILSVIEQKSKNSSKYINNYYDNLHNDRSHIETSSSYLDQLKNCQTNTSDQIKNIPWDVTQINNNIKRDNLEQSNKILTDVQINSNNEKIHECNCNDKRPDNNVLYQLLQRQGAPETSIDTFSGNPVNYNYFMATFEECVETKIPDPRGRLTRLIKYTGGDANELIKHCIHLPGLEGYNKAKYLLRKNFGDPYKVLCAYKEDLKKYPMLRAGDGESMRRFYAFLEKLNVVLSVEMTIPLESQDILIQCKSKLPFFLQDRWNRKAYARKKTTQRIPCMQDFLDFVSDENDLINDPLFSRNQNTKNNFETQKQNKFNSFYTNQSSNQPPNLKSSFCFYCKGNHQLDDCENFGKLELNDKNQFVFEKRLCYGCLYPTSPIHNSKSCKRRKTCKICKKSHPSSLHGYLQKQTNISTESKANFSCNIQSEITSLCIVPVYLYYNNRSVLTYALLDNCSQGTFIKQSLVNELRLQGTKTKINIRTITGESNEDSLVIENLKVQSYNKDSSPITLPKTYSRNELPINREEILTPESISKWNYLNKIKETLPNKLDADVGILIGANCSKALEPHEIIKSQENGPYAFRTKLGWCIVGLIDGAQNNSTIFHTNHVQIKDKYHCTSNISNWKTFSANEKIKDLSIADMFEKMYNIDFDESFDKQIKLDLNLSQDDKKFIKLMDDNVKHVNGHYELPLPFRNPDVIMPNNYYQAIKRATYLKTKMTKNKTFKDDYTNFMNDIVKKGYAKKVGKTSAEGKTWYIPHHGVYHPRKPNKIRVVFDCSATYEGTSLNSQLIQGPDLTNQLLGVLLRFRQEEIAIVADIEAMFYQVKVPDNQTSFLRFLWWPDGDLNKELQHFEMCVHIFGGASSSACSNYALRKTAIDFENFGDEASKTLKNNFYVDDMLKSVESISKAIELANSLIKLCKSGGFRLTKFFSNKREVLEKIPKHEISKNITNLDLLHDSLPHEQALGVHWNVENDCFGFNINTKNKAVTKRGILSTISSIYDPFGFASPFILYGRKIMQDLCRSKVNWDENVSEKVKLDWEKWKKNLPELEKIQVKRCLKPKDFGEINHICLHTFSDASEAGYGAVCYLRLINNEGKIHCSLVAAKSRVAPLKAVSIPRLELTAATIAVKLANKLKSELEIVMEQRYWTDSEVVLGYIKNESKRFKTFVANRIQFIHDNSEIKDWAHISTKQNVADIASRGANAAKVDNYHEWFHGPKFLWENETEWEHKNLSRIDLPEIKSTVNVNSTSLCINNNLPFFDRISSWKKIIRISAYVAKFIHAMKNYIRTKHMKNGPENVSLTIDELNKGQTLLIKTVQKSYFQSEIYQLATKSSLKSNLYNIRKLDPFIDDSGILRVGGRLRRSNIDGTIVHPILLPKKGNVTDSFVRWCHEKSGHSGRGMTQSVIRDSGVWILGGSSRIRHIIYRCVTCRKSRGMFESQKMSDLPIDRVQAEAPFSYCAVDMFGPFEIKEGRKLLKRYGALFTCLSSRAIHIEITNYLDTSSFINALRRFIARRGNIRLLRSDNGTNFVGAERELRENLEKLDNSKINEYLQEMGADWLKWRKNPPRASHMGGVWERQIRTVKNVLFVLVKQHATQLDDESFRTLMTEVEGIVNSRPLTTDTLSDPNDPQPLTPMKLLTMKTKFVLPPLGTFMAADVYSRRRWRRVQHLANEFWCRWRKEYLLTLQKRNKWKSERRNLQNGDVVMMKDELAKRNRWPLAVVIETYPDELGIVRRVRLKLENTCLERPIHKLVLLCPTEGFPAKEPTRCSDDQDDAIANTTPSSDVKDDGSTDTTATNGQDDVSS